VFRPRDIVQFASDFDGDLHLFPASLEERDYALHWQVWLIGSDGSRREAPLSTVTMCVTNGVVSNPLGPDGHQRVTGWEVDFPHPGEIEICVDGQPVLRLKHPRG
jgi:hypothetical protein